MLEVFRTPRRTAGSGRLDGHTVPPSRGHREGSHEDKRGKLRITLRLHAPASSHQLLAPCSYHPETHSLTCVLAMLELILCHFETINATDETLR